MSTATVRPNLKNWLTLAGSSFGKKRCHMEGLTIYLYMPFYLKVKLNLNPYINRGSVKRLYKAVWCRWFTECSHHRQWLWEIWHGNQSFVYAYYIKKQWALLLFSSPISEELYYLLQACLVICRVTWFSCCRRTEKPSPSFAADLPVYQAEL